MNSFNYKKAVQSANYIIEKTGEPLDKMKVIKLLWIADRYHLRKYARLVTGDDYFAMVNGPVASQTLNLLNKDTGHIGTRELSYSNTYLSSPVKNKISTKSPTDKRFLSESDLEALNFAIDKFSSFSTTKLRDLSHKYPEYKKFEKALERNGGGRIEMKTEDFFKEADNDEYEKIFSTNEQLLDLNKKIYEENESYRQNQ